MSINPYTMSREELYSGKYTTIQLLKAACGEGFWSKAIRQLGEDEVFQELETFLAEVRSGEGVDNPGAVMTKRLKARGVK